MKSSIVMIGLVILVGLALTATQVLAAPTGSPVMKKTPGANDPGTIINPSDDPRNNDKAPRADKKDHNRRDKTGDPNSENEISPDLLKDKKPDKLDKEKMKKEGFRGTIVSVSDGKMVIRLKSGEEITITLDEETRLHFPGLKDGVTTSLAGLQITIRAAQGEEGTEPIALSLHVIPGKPTSIHRVGLVTDYEPGVSITIQGKHGEMTYSLEGTQIITKGGEVIPNQTRVTIISPRDVITSPDSPPVAKGIVVHPEDGGSAED